MLDGREARTSSTDWHIVWWPVMRLFPGCGDTRPHERILLANSFIAPKMTKISYFEVQNDRNLFVSSPIFDLFEFASSILSCGRVSCGRETAVSLPPLYTVIKRSLSTVIHFAMITHGL